MELLSSEEQFEKKKKYLALLDEVEDTYSKGNFSVETTDKVININNEANKLYFACSTRELVSHNDQVLLDARILNTSFNILNQIVNNFECNLNPLKINTFVNNIKSLVDNDILKNGGKLFSYTSSVINPVPRLKVLAPSPPSLNSQLNKTSQIEKKFTQRKVSKKTELFKTEPEKLHSRNDLREETDDNDTVQFLLWTLRKLAEKDIKFVNLIEFLYDPKDFTTTVYYCFYMVFLIRDGFVRLFADNNNRCALALTSKESREKSDKTVSSQFLLSLDYNIWKTAVKRYRITSSYLKPWKAKWEQKKTKE